MSHGDAVRSALLLLGCGLVAAFAVSFALGLRPDPSDPVPARAEPVAVEDDRRGEIRVEVLNGAGRAGLAREATDLLVSRGFDVVYFGNARDFGRETSLVLDRAGDDAAARAVADALGIVDVRTEPEHELVLHATVILGQDWRTPTPEPESEWRTAAGGLWQRLREALPF